MTELDQVVEVDAVGVDVKESGDKRVPWDACE